MLVGVLSPGPAGPIRTEPRADVPLLCLQFWHKACFHCETCKMTLNMKNYKGYEKKPYCNA